MSAKLRITVVDASRLAKGVAKTPMDRMKESVHGVFHPIDNFKKAWNPDKAKVVMAFGNNAVELEASKVPYEYDLNANKSYELKFFDPLADKKKSFFKVGLASFNFLTGVALDQGLFTSTFMGEMGADTAESFVNFGESTVSFALKDNDVLEISVQPDMFGSVKIKKL